VSRRRDAEPFEHSYPKAPAPVGQHLQIGDDITGDDDVELHGQFNGRIEVQGMVLVGETAEVRADIKGATVISVHGSETGHDRAAGRCRLLVFSLPQLLPRRPLDRHPWLRRPRRTDGSVSVALRHGLSRVRM